MWAVVADTGGTWALLEIWVDEGKAVEYATAVKQRNPEWVVYVFTDWKRIDEAQED